MPVAGQRVIELFGQGVCLSEIDGQSGDSLRKQAFNGAGDATKLRVTQGKVACAVELVQEEAGGGCMAFVGEKVAVGVCKPFRLQ